MAPVCEVATPSVSASTVVNTTRTANRHNATSKLNSNNNNVYNNSCDTTLVLM